MKITVIGGSRGLGFETTKTLLATGHDVTVFSRHAASMAFSHHRLIKIDGDVNDTTNLVPALAHRDAVICVLGLPTVQAIGPPLAGRNTTLSRGTANIITVMQRQNVKRLLCVTAIGTGDSAASCSVVARLGLRLGLRWLFKEKDRQEQLIRASRLQWTIIRPTALTNGKQHQRLDDSKGTFGMFSHISRTDAAGEMVRIIADNSTDKAAVILSYPPRLGDSLRFIKDYL